MKLLPAMLILILLPLVTMAVDITDTGCGDDKACFNSPEGCTLDGGDCTFFFSYANDTSSVDFELLADRSVTGGAGWAAVAFSYDKTMGNDSVVMCINSDRADVDPAAKNGFNVGQVNTLSSDITGLSNIAVSVTNNILSCTFTREYSVAANDNFFDLQSRSFYFMMGTGPVVSGTPLEHEKDPYVSATVLDILSKDDIMASEGSSSSSEEVDGVASLHPVATLVLSLCGLVMALFH